MGEGNGRKEENQTMDCPYAFADSAKRLHGGE